MPSGVGPQLYRGEHRHFHRNTDADDDDVCLPIRLFQRWHNQKLKEGASVKVLTSKVGLANLFQGK